MAVYEGKQGIASLREKIKLKSKMLVGESVEKITITLVDDSPLGAPYYQSKQGLVVNDVGDFKNSWSVGLGSIDSTVRPADTEGTAAVVDAIIKGKAYNFEETVFVTNNTDHAEKVEEGWESIGLRALRGWGDKEGYHVVENNTATAVAILEAVAQKVSKL